LQEGRTSGKLLDFHTGEWQRKEREADEDIRAGRVRRFPDVEALITNLRGA